MAPRLLAGGDLRARVVSDAPSFGQAGPTRWRYPERPAPTLSRLGPTVSALSRLAAVALPLRYYMSPWVGDEGGRVHPKNFQRASRPPEPDGDARKEHP
jgi:hypothetical protein